MPRRVLQTIRLSPSSSSSSPPPSNSAEKLSPANADLWAGFVSSISVTGGATVVLGVADSPALSLGDFQPSISIACRGWISQRGQRTSTRRRRPSFPFSPCLWAALFVQSREIGRITSLSSEAGANVGNIGRAKFRSGIMKEKKKTTRAIVQSNQSNIDNLSPV
jgi:hypothetical protein